MPWNGLPAELRLMIFETVSDPDPNFAQHERHIHAPDGSYAWAPYTAVSREWQEFFERRTFAALSLSGKDLETFSAVVTRCPARLAYIARLRLTIDLPPLRLMDVDTCEDEATMTRHGSIFTHHMWRLLHALSAWKEPGPADGCPLRVRDDAMFRAGKINSAIGIQLELGVQCMTAAIRYNPNLPMPHRPIGEDEDHFQILEAMGVGYPDRIINRFPLTIPPAACQRILGGRLLVLGKDTGNKRGQQQSPPVAAIVRKLVVGRRFYRGIHPKTLARLLRENLPRVQFAHFEPWRPVTEANRDVLMRGYGALLQRLPPSVDSLSIFVESDCIVHHHEQYPNPNSLDPDPVPLRRPPPSLGLQVAVASRRLVVLNVAFLTEAEDVFAAIAHLRASATWPRLRRLVLTSSILSPTSAPTSISRLLLAAAATAARMPHLHQFELWFSRGPHACSFTVNCGTDCGTDTPYIRLGATWPQANAAMTRDVRHAWQSVVATWTSAPIRFLQSIVNTNVLVDEDGRQQIMDARRLVLQCPDTLAHEGLFAQSLEDMARERCWKEL